MCGGEEVELREEVEGKGDIARDGEEERLLAFLYCNSLFRECRDR